MVKMLYKYVVFTFETRLLVEDATAVKYNLPSIPCFIEYGRILASLKLIGKGTCVQTVPKGNY